MTDEVLVLSHSARLERVGLVDKDSPLLAQVGERLAIDPDVLLTHSVYEFRAEISNDQLDSHYTHMAESTLRNYVKDSKRGIAFLKGHNWRELPVGYSTDGKYEEDGGRKRVLTDFYTIEGLQETDDLILRMKSGLVRDVSVGFSGGKAVCDLCGRSFWECWHFPGEAYDVVENKKTVNKVATYTIEDAHLNEVSAVFDGSTPDAMVLKAQRFAEGGQLTRQQIEHLSMRYRVVLPMNPRAKAFPVATTGGKTMDERQLKILGDSFRNAGIATDDELSVLDPELALVLVDKMAGRIQALTPQAEDGRTYREDLVAGALAQGVRAYGNDFKKEGYEALLRNASLETIKQVGEDWKKIADKGLPAGRSSVSDDQTPVKEEGEAEKPRVRVPESAYSTGRK